MVQANVKSEPQEPSIVTVPKVEMLDASVPRSEPYKQPYTVYQSPLDVPYITENAFKEGLHMVKSIKTQVNQLEIGSKLRKDVWLKEIERLVLASSGLDCMRLSLLTIV
jgi:hypothetical protein